MITNHPLQKLRQREQLVHSLLCVGLDSEFTKIPAKFQTQKNPQFAFNKWIIDETHEFVSSYKPNLAFYEARGEQGIHDLKLTLEYLHELYPDIFLIADAKRADIGSTNVGYVTSIFDWYGFDAITLHPYLGQEALQPFLDREDKVSILLCRTSNPGAGEFQDLLIGRKPLWQVVAETVARKWNVHQNCMLVVGATYPKEMALIRKAVGEQMTFLVPGIGKQGGDLAACLQAGLNAKKRGLILNSARGIIFAADPKVAAQKLRDQINMLS